MSARREKWERERERKREREREREGGGGSGSVNLENMTAPADKLIPDPDRI